MLLVAMLLLVVMLVALRQWPEVYDLCHTFLHVV